MLRKQNCCTELFSLGHLDIRVIPIGLSVSGTYGCVDGEKGGEGVWSLGGAGVGGWGVCEGGGCGAAESHTRNV